MSEHVFAFFVAVILLVIGLWFAFAAPCSWYAGAAVTSVPARCIRELAGPQGGRR